MPEILKIEIKIDRSNQSILTINGTKLSVESVSAGVNTLGGLSFRKCTTCLGGLIAEQLFSKIVAIKSAVNEHEDIDLWERISDSDLLENLNFKLM